MMVAKPKRKTKTKKKKKMREEMDVDIEEHKTEHKLHTLQTFNTNKEDDIQQQQQDLSEYNTTHHCTELVWCEVGLQNKRHLNFMELYEKAPKKCSRKQLFESTLLQYINKDYFKNNYKYGNIQHDTDGFCVLLWTSSDCHQYKKIPKGIRKEECKSFQIHKYIQNSLIYDDVTGLKLSMNIIRGINNTINNHPTKHQLIGYRGSKMSVKEFNAFEVNETRRVAMYVACSINKRIAQLFIGRGCVLITIIIPEGCLNARVVPSPMTMFPNEVEILIPPYSSFKCVGRKETIRNNESVRELVLLLTKDNKKEQFDGLKNVPYWTA